MNSRIYEYLLAIEEEQNLSRAAARCWLSQPALSQQLKSYEKKLGFPVFERSRSAMRPTSRGKIVLETARQIIKTEQELQESLESLKQTALQNVHIYIEDTMRNMFLRDIWPQVLKTYPQARLTLTAGDCENALQFLENHSADLLILTTQEIFPQHYIQKPFHKDQYLLAADPSHYSEAELIKKMDKKGDWKHDTVFVKENYSIYPSLQQKAMSEIGLDAAHLYPASTYQNAARLCSTKKGLSVLPESLFHIIKTDLLQIRLPVPFIATSLLVWKEEQAFNPLYHLIGELLEQKYQALQNA